MGLALVPFLALWVVMMAAMMFPSVTPVAIMWSKVIRATSDGWRRAWRLSSFVAGYLVAWTAFGVAAYLALWGTQRLVEARPGSAPWLGAAVFAVAGIYQLTPAKQACLRHCRSPVSALLHYGNLPRPGEGSSGRHPPRVVLRRLLLGLDARPGSGRRDEHRGDGGPRGDHLRREDLAARRRTLADGWSRVPRDRRASYPSFPGCCRDSSRRCQAGCSPARVLKTFRADGDPNQRVQRRSDGVRRRAVAPCCQART